MSETQIVAKIKAPDMENGKYSIIVYSYLFGQYRIMLTRVDQLDTGAPEGHGVIVRELDTYQRGKMEEVIEQISRQPDPEAYCESLAKPYNCEYEGGRIRLDNTPEDRPAGS